MSYSTIVLSDSPEAYWKLDEGSGTSIADSSGNGHTGTIVNSGGANVTFNGFSIPSLPTTHSLHFPGNVGGSSAVVSVTSLTSLPTTGHYTIEVWYRPETDDNGGFVGYGDFSTTNGSLALRQNGISGLANYWWSDDLITGFATVFPLWHYAAATFDGTNRTIYFDGVEVANDTPTGLSAVLANFTIGQTHDSSEAFTGSLAHIAIYNTALPNTTIERHCVAGKSLYAQQVIADSPSAYWPISEPTETLGDYFFDITGNGNGYSSIGGVVLAGSSSVPGDSYEMSPTFDGSGGLQFLDTGLPSGTSDLTIEVWFLTPSVGGLESLLSYGNFGLGGTGGGTLFQLNSTTSISFGFANDSPPVTVPDVSNQWHHLVGTWVNGSSTRTLYLDGAQVFQDTPTFTNGMTLTGQGQIGGISGIGQNFTGTLAHAAIYPTALSSGTVLVHYTLGIGIYEAVVLSDSPSSYWPMHEVSGSNAIDITGGRIANASAGVIQGVAFGIPGDLGSPTASFDGSGGYTFSDVGLPNGAVDFSLEAWTFITPNVPGGGVAALAYGTFGGGSGFGADVGYDDDTHSHFDWNGVVGPSSLLGNVDGAWHHIVGTWNNGTSTRTLYFDGISVLSDTPSVSPLALSGTGAIGVINGAGFNLVGDLAHVAIYPTELSSVRVAAHFTAGGGTSVAALTPTALTEASVLHATATFGPPNPHSLIPSAQITTTVLSDAGIETLVRVCYIYGTLTDTSGFPVPRAVIQAQLNTAGINVTVGSAPDTVDPKQQSATADINGFWSMFLIAPVDMTPNNLYYNFVFDALSPNKFSKSTTSFTYSSSPININSIVASTPSPSGTRVAMTNVVLSPDGEPMVGVAINCQVSQDCIDTETSSSISGRAVIQTSTDTVGSYQLNLVPVSLLTPGGVFYIVNEGQGSNAKYFTAPDIGGIINDNLTTPVAAGSTGSPPGSVAADTVEADDYPNPVTLSDNILVNLRRIRHQIKVFKGGSVAWNSATGIFQNQVLSESTEAQTLDTLTGSTTATNQFNRIRYYMGQYVGGTWNTIKQFIFLQGTSPGTAQSGHIHITGNLVADGTLAGSNFDPTAQVPHGSIPVYTTIYGRETLGPYNQFL